MFCNLVVPRSNRILQHFTKYSRRTIQHIMTTLTESVSQVKSFIDLTIVGLMPSDETNYLTQQVKSEAFLNKETQIDDIISSFQFEYELTVQGEEDQVKQIEAFNGELSLKLKGVIFTSAFNELITDIVDSSTSLDSTFFNRIAILLDFLIHLVSTNGIKHLFYESILKLLTILSSAHQIEEFWYYMESRELTIANSIFSNSVISDRISFLEICNKLTDKRTKDLNEKDTYNDSFQFRVRAFLSNIFLFEDNTGLNKYFHVSTKTIVDFKKVKSPFIDDILYINRVFNDPYLYLKRTHTSELKSLMTGIQHVYGYLLKEEVASYKKTKWDNLVVVAEKSKAEEEYLTKKYADRLYFPQNYLLSGFEKNSELGDEDTKFLNSQFNESKVRLQYLTMIFIICNLYLELTVGGKQDFLKSLGSATTLKHLTDGVLTEANKKFFISVKNEIINTLKSVDPSFALLLQHLAVTERIWWGWLIYGKDPQTNKTLFVNKLVGVDELEEAQKKFDSLFPYKGKKYFNKFITPQLSKKMRTKTGLDQVAEGIRIDHGLKIDQLNDKIQVGGDENEIDNDVEERNVWIWKQLRGARDNWLDIGKSISGESLSGPEKPVKQEPIAEDVPEKNEHSEAVSKEETTDPAELKTEQTQNEPTPEPTLERTPEPSNDIEDSQTPEEVDVTPSRKRERSTSGEDEPELKKVKVE